MATRGKNGRFIKTTKVPVWYEASLEPVSTSLVPMQSTSTPDSIEELIEAARSLERTSPVERAITMTEERMRRRFNWHYNAWVAGTVVGMFCMFELGKYFAS